MIFKTKNTATLITRPRRFGKTINLSMMHLFFDLEAEAVEFVFNLNYMGALLPTQVFATKQNQSLLFTSDGELTPRSHKIINTTSMERFGTPNELIGTLLYLVDPRASGFVNGVVIPVDGGFSAYLGV